MNELQIFENKDFGKVRTVTLNGAPCFVAADICRALDIANSRDAVKRLDDDERGVVSTDTLGGVQEMTVVNESGLYSLVLGSRKPEAKQFKRWITHEVIPTIRKTGGYVNNDELFVRTYLPNADDTTKALFRSTLETIRAQNAKLEEYKPKAIFADAVSASKSSILVGELAKILQQNGVAIGQNRLFAWLRNNGYLCCYGERYNMPTQRSMEMSLFEIKETTINNPDGSIRVSRTVKVTGKGQQYFINKFLGGSAEA